MRIRKIPGISFSLLAAAVLFLSFLALLCVSPATAASAHSPVELKILHVNDTHGHIIPYIENSISTQVPVSGADHMAKMIENERAANPDGTIVLSAGDMFQGTPVSNIFRGKPVIEIMNYLKFDAMALGNHEFDWGQDVLHGIISSAAFPVLSANISRKDGKPFEGAKPYVIIERKGLSIAIIGLTTPEAPVTSKPGNLVGLSFARPADIMPRLVKEVRAKGAALVIVLSHIGLNADKELAKAVRGIDIIVGGHSHTVVPDPVNQSGTIVVQAGSNGLYLGVLDILFDPAKKEVTGYTEKNELELVSAGPEDKTDRAVAQIVDSYEKKVREEFSKVIGMAALDLLRQPAAESNLGDLITDAMRESSGAQIAFYNGGGIRTDLLKGPITLESVYTVLPFDNDIVTMDLTGKQIKQLLEKSGNRDKILQVSGMTVQYDRTKPAGSRVVSMQIAGKTLSPNAVYRVAINDFLAAGGDQFATFTRGKNPVFGSPVRDVVSEYIRNHSPLDVQVQGRIAFK